MSPNRRFRSRSALFSLAALVLALVVDIIVERPGLPGSAPVHLTVLLGFFLAIVIAEQLRVGVDEPRASSPMGGSILLALAVATTSTEHRLLDYSALSCVLVGAGALFVGLFPHWLRHPRRRRDLVNEFLSRTLAFAVVALVLRGQPLGFERSLLDVIAGLPGATATVVLLFFALLGPAVEIPLEAWYRAGAARVPFRRSLSFEFRGRVSLSAAVVVTAVLIADCLPVLGLIAVPLMMLPLGLTQVAVRRHAAIRSTYRQTVIALSRLPEAIGVVPRGHAVNVAAISSEIGRHLGLSEREVSELEYAALLHDIGQVTLRHPIPYGATTSAAPTDQQRIADDGAAIVRETGVLDNVADIVELQAVRFARVIEKDEKIPLASRIIKVVNAYADFCEVASMTEGNRDPQATAMERLYLGLGYEYDPEVVTALERYLGPTLGYPPDR